VQRLKADIVAGRFGSVKRVKGMAGWQRLDEYYSRSSWAGKLRINGDWILDGTINNPLAHLLANQLYFASMEAGKLAEPVSVQAELYHGHAIESEDTSSLRIQTSDQVEVLFNASLCSELQTGPITTIECENAVVEYVNFNEATITYSDGKTQRLVNENEQRIHMLEKLAQCYNERKPYLVTLGMCRPFTVSVNGAFESCGTVHNVDDKFLLRSEYGDSIKTIIKGIDHLLQIAHDNGKLFSEISTSWSQSSKPLDVQGYAKFPSSGFNC
jgi:predicted dehydrogenase